MGDQVIAYDPTTGTSSTQTVQHVWVNHDTDLLDVTLHSAGHDTPTRAGTSDAKQRAVALRAHGLRAPPADDQAAAQADLAHSATDATTAPAAAAGAAVARGETLHTTANHPWLTADRGWVPAGELRLGEHVVELGGRTATITALLVRPGAATYYNLTVSTLHTYAVGTSRAVVHNDTCLGPNDPSQAAARQRIGYAKKAAQGQRAGVWVMEASGKPFAQESSGVAVHSAYGPATMYNTADGAGTCAEFRCGAYTAQLYGVGLGRGDELYMYLYHERSAPPCGSCRNALRLWAQDNQAPIHLYWLDKNDKLWATTFPG